eukprot:5542198-Pyramimonas_sp.AAC.1
MDAPPPGRSQGGTQDLWPGRRPFKPAGDWGVGPLAVRYSRGPEEGTRFVGEGLGVPEVLHSLPRVFLRLPKGKSK